MQSENIISILTNHRCKLTYENFYALYPKSTYHLWNQYKSIVCYFEKYRNNTNYVYMTFVINDFREQRLHFIFNEINLCKILFELWFNKDEDFDGIYINYISKKYKSQIINNQPFFMWCLNI